MRLQITLTDGEQSTHDLTPAIRVAFERNFKCGFWKRLRDEQREEDGFWLAWECLRRDALLKGSSVLPFGEQFLETLADVELVDDSPNG